MFAFVLPEITNISVNHHVPSRNSRWTFFMNPSHQLDSSGRFRQSMNTKMSFGLFFIRTFAFGHRHFFWITVTITHRTFFRTLLCIFIDICFFALLPSLRVVTVLVFRSLSCFLSHVLDILHNSSHPWTNRICICKPAFSFFGLSPLYAFYFIS